MIVSLPAVGGGEVKGPVNVSIAVGKSTQRQNGTNDNRVAWASDVSEGRMRCVAVSDVGVAMSPEL